MPKTSVLDDTITVTYEQIDEKTGYPVTAFEVSEQG